MNAYLYLCLLLFILAVVGLALTLQQDMKPATQPANYRWIKWAIVMALFATIDAMMLLVQPWA